MTSPKPESRLGAIVRALRSRNFRLFFAGQSISLIGTWMQRIALGWLVYRLTDSALLLAWSGSRPDSRFSVVAVGRRAGRPAQPAPPDRHRHPDAGDVARLRPGRLDLSRRMIWHIFVLGLVLGVVNAFDMPMRSRSGRDRGRKKTWSTPSR